MLCRQLNKDGPAVDYGPAMVSVRQALSSDLLQQLKQAFRKDSKNLLAMNSVSRNDFLSVVLKRDVSLEGIHTFSNKVELESKVANQKSSGRCWIFAGLNVLRLHLMKKFKLEEFEFSQAHLFWCDKFEKSNFFLENIISTLSEPTDSRLVQYLLANPVQDGGQWDMLVNLIEKYGVMPKSAFPECYHSGNSRMLNWLITCKLREFACALRKAFSEGQSMESIQMTKAKMLEEVHRILMISLGDPPQTFDWNFRDKEKAYHSLPGLDPMRFYREIVDCPLAETVSLINDPRNEYYKLYTVEYLGNVAGGRAVAYINLPIDELKGCAIKSIKENQPVWFGCDVSKYFHRQSGMLDTELFDYPLVFDTALNLDKADRVRYGESAMTHAMTLTGVDLQEGRPRKWRVENSWGDENGDKGYLCMSDAWFNEYTYQVVVSKSHVPSEILSIALQDPIVLPAWDPMGALA